MTGEPVRPTAEAAERGALLAFEFAQRHLRPDGIVLTKGAQQNLANAFAALAAQAQRDAAELEVLKPDFAERGALLSRIGQALGCEHHGEILAALQRDAEAVAKLREFVALAEAGQEAAEAESERRYHLLAAAEQRGRRLEALLREEQIRADAWRMRYEAQKELTRSLPNTLAHLRALMAPPAEDAR